jgi:outer membrane protein assembly factor BamB
MTRFLLLLLAAVALAWLAPARALAEPEIPAERLDLDGVPEIRLDSLRPLKAVPIDGPSGRKGWAVLLVNGKGQGSAMTIPSPAVQDGRVIVGGGVGSRSLWAFDVRNGRKLWRSDLNDNGPSTVAVTPSRTIVNTESCTTYGIDTRTGRRVWAKWVGSNVWASPTIAGVRVLAAHRHPKGPGFALTSLDLQSGKIQWQRPLASDLVGAPIWDGSRAYVTGQDGRLSCYDSRGDLLWTRDMHAGSAPWVDRRGVFVAVRSASGEPLVSHLDARSGTLRWRSDSPGNRRGEMVSVARLARQKRVVRTAWCEDPPRPVVVGDSCFLAGGKTMRVLDVRTGATNAEVLLPAGRFHAPPAVLGRTLLYATANGHLLEIDVTTGALRRALKVGLPMLSQPVVADGRVFVVAGGALLAIPWGEADGPCWPQWGGDEHRTGSLAQGRRRRDAVVTFNTVPGTGNQPT